MQTSGATCREIVACAGMTMVSCVATSTLVRNDAERPQRIEFLPCLWHRFPRTVGLGSPGLQTRGTLTPVSSNRYKT
jgi:hypothetical protein